MTAALLFGIAIWAWLIVAVSSRFDYIAGGVALTAIWLLGVIVLTVIGDMEWS